MRLAAALLLAVLAAGCASVEFRRTTETSGTFHSSGIALTLLSWDFPTAAINIARENASDSRQPNMVVRRSSIWPSLGPLDFLFEIVSVRRASISGTWGFVPDEPVEG